MPFTAKWEALTFFRKTNQKIFPIGSTMVDLACCITINKHEGIYLPYASKLYPECLFLGIEQYCRVICQTSAKQCQSAYDIFKYQNPRYI